jgi:Flp pilus assembly pilin Flp
MITSAFKALWQEEDGQDLVEYSLLLAFIALAAISILKGAGTSINALFGTMSTALVSANSAATSTAGS